MEQTLSRTSASTGAQSSAPPVNPYETDAKIDLSPIEKVYSAISTRKWVVLAIIISCLIAGFVLTALATPQYTATARIEISRQQANVTNVEGVEEADRTRDFEFYDTQYSLLESRSLAERVVRDEGFASDDDFFATFEVDPDAGTVVPEGDQSLQTARDRNRRLKSATDILLSNVTIAPIRGSSLVDIQFTSPDRALSERVSNAWVEQFIESNLARRFSTTADARKFLEEQLDNLRGRLEESEKQLVDYASQTGIVTFGGSESPGGGTTDAPQRTLVASELQAMSASLSQARAERIAAQSALQQASGSKASQADPTIGRLRERLAVVSADRAKLLSTFEPEYPAVEALTTQMESLQRAIRAEESRSRSSLQENYQEALQRESQLSQQVQALKSQFSNQNQDSIQYNIYEREVETNRELYEGLLQRYKEIGVAGVGPNNVAIVDRAQLPGRPSSPSLLINLALALLLGTGLAGGYVFVREQLDGSLRDPADLKRLLGLAPLGTVPVIKNDDLSEEILDRKSPISEAYMSIASSLSFLTAHGTPKSILLTSAVPNEGKSTSAIAIAHMLARTGKSTLLIDADMRNPSVHKFFEFDNEEGLSNVLSGNADPRDMIRDTDTENLSIMTAGPIPPNPAELLNESHLEELLSEGQFDCDHIVIDSPPVLGLADSPLLASNVEGVIFTIQANKTKFRSVKSAIIRLRSAHATTFGAIVTQVDSRNDAYGYGSTYGYGYGYGEKSEG